MIRFTLAISIFILILAACQQNSPEPAPPAEYVGVMLEPEGQIQQIHDPVMAFADGIYYVFSTGRRLPVICSADKITWESCGRVFFRNPAWTRDINPNLNDIWAPDISFFNNKWHLYYAVSNFGTQNSAIALATNTTLDLESPDFEWVDQGIVLRSQPGDPWNAIDANVVIDEEGEPWLAWGSYWSGIWLGKIEAATGQLAGEAPDFHHLANRSAGAEGNPAIEAPFIVKRGETWYLFASFDQCCQGAASTYNVRVGRSDSLTGPYVDRDGVPMTEGGGTRILGAYGRWQGPGHNGILIEEDAFWMVYHAYDSQQNGVPKLHLESLSWDADGWPSLPSQKE